LHHYFVFFLCQDNAYWRIVALIVFVNSKIAKISIVGAGMMSAPGVAAQMFEALFDGDDLANPERVQELWANAGN
jgi:hypothetical protein